MNEFSVAAPAPALAVPSRAPKVGDAPPLIAPNSGQSTGASAQDKRAAAPQDPAAKARQMRDDRRSPEKVLTGPPPAFEASLLEVEGQLDTIIRRVAAARAHEANRNGQATAPAAQPRAIPTEVAQDGNQAPTPAQTALSATETPFEHGQEVAEPMP